MTGGKGQLFINILETDDQIQRKILQAIAEETNKKISNEFLNYVHHILMDYIIGY